MDRLQWNEPAGYRRAAFRQSERRNPLDALKFAAVVIGVILILRGLAGIGNPNRNLPGWPATLALSLIVAIVAAFVLPWVLSYVSVSVVILSEKGVNNNIVGHGATIYFWPWEQVAYCSTSIENTSGNSYQTLSLHGQQDEVLTTFGLRQKPTIEEIRDSLGRYKKELRGS